MGVISVNCYYYEFPSEDFSWDYSLCIFSMNSPNFIIGIPFYFLDELWFFSSDSYIFIPNLMK
jgi:hypothetical protein